MSDQPDWQADAEFLAGAVQQLLDAGDLDEIIHAERIAAEALAAHRRLRQATPSPDEAWAGGGGPAGF